MPEAVEDDEDSEAMAAADGAEGNALSAPTLSTLPSMWSGVEGGDMSAPSAYCSIDVFGANGVGLGCSVGEPPILLSKLPLEQFEPA